MSVKIITSDTKLICKSFPVRLIVLVAILYIIFLVAVLTTEHSLKLVDLALFHLVFFVVVSVQQHIQTIINIKTREVTIIKKGLLNKSCVVLPLSDIKSIELLRGRGSAVATGGAIVFNTYNAKHIKITSSDIFTNNDRSSTQSYNKIASFTGLNKPR